MTLATSEEPLTLVAPHQYPRVIKLFLVIILCGVTYGVYLIPPYYQAMKRMHLAQMAYQQEHYQQAATIYLTLLQQYPNFKSARLGAAEALFSYHDEESCQQALKLLGSIGLDTEEYTRLKKVMPEAYQGYFISQKRKSR